MGQLLAEKIMGTENPILTALYHKTPSTLPEPFQWCAFQTAFTAAGFYDSWIDRKARVTNTSSVV